MTFSLCEEENTPVKNCAVRYTSSVPHINTNVRPEVFETMQDATLKTWLNVGHARNCRPYLDGQLCPKYLDSCHNRNGSSQH